MTSPHTEHNEEGDVWDGSLSFVSQAILKQTANHLGVGDLHQGQILHLTRTYAQLDCHIMRLCIYAI